MVSSNRLYYELLIGIGTTLYGISVVTSRCAMNYNIGPYTFNALQHLVATSCLIFLRPLLKKLTYNSIEYDKQDNIQDNKQQEQQEQQQQGRGEEIIVDNDKLEWFYQRSPKWIQNKHIELIILGTACAIPNFLASSLNQLGLVTVEAGKSAFLTSLYVVFTPLIQYILHGSKAQITTLTWISALVSLFGSYLLAGCTETSFIDTISIGEIYTIVGAFLWAIGILLTDYAVDRVDCIDLVSLELSISTLFCIILNIFYEPEGIKPLFTFSSPLLTSSLSMSWLLIIATGGIEAIAFLLDTIGQIHTSGSRAALLMGLDSVVTVIVAYIFLNEKLTFLESIGCICLLLSTLLATLGSNDNIDDDEEDDDDGEEERQIEEGEILVTEEEQEEVDIEVGEDDINKLDRGKVNLDNHKDVKKYIKKNDKKTSPIQSIPFHRIKSTEQFAGELRKQRYVLLLSRRGVPIRRGKRDRSNTLHDDPRNDKNRQSADNSTFQLSLPQTFNNQQTSTNLSSSLPPLSSTYDFFGGISSYLPINRTKPISQDDTAINHSNKNTEMTPLLIKK